MINMSEIREALGYVNQIIDSNFKRLPNLKRAYGKIKSIMSNNAKVLVEILSTEEEEKNRELWFLNKTGEILAVDDLVWIYYWNTITDGYVAVKQGLSNAGRKPAWMTYGWVMGNEEDLEKFSEMAQNVHRLYFNPAFVPYYPDG